MDETSLNLHPDAPIPPTGNCGTGTPIEQKYELYIYENRQKKVSLTGKLVKRVVEYKSSAERIFLDYRKCPS